MTQDRIDLDASGGVDDVVINNVSTLRLERMSDGHVWIRAYTSNGRPDHVFGISAAGHVSITHEED